jgi:hypothetical protein
LETAIPGSSKEILYLLSEKDTRENEEGEGLSENQMQEEWRYLSSFGVVIEVSLRCNMQ